MFTGGGRIAQWKFPKHLTHCRIKMCGMEFDDRSKAIAHYRKQHAPKFTYCSNCNKPFSARRVYNIENHNRKKHSDINMFDSDSTERVRSREQSSQPESV